MKAQDQKLRYVLAANIRACREKMNISQEKLGELCGLHRTYVGSVERAERNISIDNIEKIATSLKDILMSSYLVLPKRCMRRSIVNSAH